ncbi:MAG: hypothetical protein JRL30_03970 [Deltaproteobacteria bacterium]|jgi:hypothetical protein|nr:hypothetical protein [Deltaproteobacteria bacterium]
MEKRFQDEKILDKVDEDKRDFIKKVVVGTAFVVPVVNSFSMDGLKIDLKAKMARADEYDQPGGYDQVGGGGYVSDATSKKKPKPPKVGSK